MPLPDWVANQARTKMEPNEQIVEVQVLKEGLFGKLAVVQTSERNIVVSRGLFSGRAFDLVSLGFGPSEGLTTAAPTIKAPKAAVETAPPQPKLAKAKPKAAPTVEPDDLTTLKGIGKVRAERLNEAGVLTFQQLVDADAAALADTLNVSAETVEAWQAAARKA